MARNKYADAIAAFKSGLALNPDDTACQQGLQRSQVCYYIYIRTSNIILQIVLMIGVVITVVSKLNYQSK